MNQQELIGQDKQYNNLLSDIDHGRVAHAYLFYGPLGVGKSLMAKMIFKHLNDHKIECDCNFCNQVDKETQPDLKVIEPAGKFITIDQSREIQKFLSRLPLQSKYKMVIINDAHELKTEAANALLKTLEDPPKNSVLVLVTSIPERLLLTIRSRCRQVCFDNISSKEIRNYIENKYGFEKRKAELVASLSEGILGKALAIAQDEDFWTERESIVEIALKLLDMDNKECFVKAEKLTSYARKKAKEIGNDESARKVKELSVGVIVSSLLIMQLIFRDALFIKETGEEAIILNKDYLEKIKSTFKNISTSKLMKCIEEIENTKIMLRKNTNAQLILQSLFLNLKEGI